MKRAIARVPSDATPQDLLYLRARQAETYEHLDYKKQALAAATEVIAIAARLKRPAVPLKQGKITYLYIAADEIDEALASMGLLFSYLGKDRLADRCLALIRNVQFRQNTLYQIVSTVIAEGRIDRARALLTRLSARKDRLEATAVLAEHFHDAGDGKRAYRLLQLVLRRACTIDDNEVAEVLRHAATTLHKWDPASSEPYQLIRRGITIATKGKGKHLYTEPWMWALWGIGKHDEALDLVLNNDADALFRLQGIKALRDAAKDDFTKTETTIQRPNDGF